MGKLLYSRFRSANTMTIKNVKTSLDKISESLTKTQDVREFLIKNTRGIVIECSKSIIAVHRSDMKNAKSHLHTANTLLVQYRKKLKVDNDLRRYLITSEQEFVEASSLIAIAEKKQIPSINVLGVSSESYVLGLLDCIGELKRFVLDKIRRENLDEAVDVFETMEELFSLLYPFANLDKIVKETRRKLDVNRMLVEDTRVVITEEIRRKALIDSIKNVYAGDGI